MSPFVSTSILNFHVKYGYLDFRCVSFVTMDFHPEIPENEHALTSSVVVLMLALFALRALCTLHVSWKLNLRSDGQRSILLY